MKALVFFLGLVIVWMNTDFWVGLGVFLACIAVAPEGDA